MDKFTNFTDIAKFVGTIATVVMAVYIVKCVCMPCLVDARRRQHTFSPEITQIIDRIREMDRIDSIESGSAAGPCITETVALGVPQAEINRSLPLVKYSKTGTHLASMDTKRHMSECPVCLNEYKEAECIRLLPNCEHIFHPICISTWLESHTTCPLCRTDVHVSKTVKTQSSLEWILSSIRRSARATGANHIENLSAHDRHSDGQLVTVEVTSPAQQQSSNVNTSGPLPSIYHPPTGRPVSPEIQEEQSSEAPAPSTSSTTLEAGFTLSSKRGSYVNVYESGPSSSSASGFNPVTSKKADSEEGYSSARTSFESIPLDTHQPERLP